jgi:hypothetical protein
MSFDLRSLPAFLSATADFRTWIQGIHAQLIAAGLVQTSDTGQINSATVNLPGTNTAAGYEIFQFNDTGVANGQSTNPVFIKVEYGVGSPTDRPSLWFTVGTGSNGAGTITGTTILGRNQLSFNNSRTSGITMPSYCAGDGGWFGLFTAADTSGAVNPQFMIIDRVRDASGVPTGEGVVCVYSSWTNGPSGFTIASYVGGAAHSANPNYLSTAGYFAGPTTTDGTNALGAGARIFGTNVAVMPAIVLCGQLRFLKAFVLFNQSDFGSIGGVTFVANNFGANHTYVTLCGLNLKNAWTFNSNDMPALLWE